MASLYIQRKMYPQDRSTEHLNVMGVTVKTGVKAERMKKKQLTEKVGAKTAASY